MEPLTSVLAALLSVVLVAVVAAAVTGVVLRRAAMARALAERPAGEAMDKLREKLDQLTARVDARLEEVSTHMRDGLGRSDKTMTGIHQRLAVIDDAQKRLTDLSTQVVGLQDILSNKQARGAFGEVQLREIVEAALPPSAYEFQKTLSNGRRADCLILLPQPPGPIVIDAKFPLESYRALRGATTEAERVAAGRAFTRDVTKHVNDIAERYIVRGETAESALLFLPSEAVYAELHAAFPNTVDESYRKRVYVVSPTTLMATLNTVRAVLRDVGMREQAVLIRDEILKLLEDVRRLDDRVSSLDKHFNLAEKDIREIRISSDKVIGRGERIRDVDLSDADAAVSTDAGQPELPTMRVVKD